MVTRLGGIEGTPFKSSSPVVIKRSNKRIKDLSAQVRIGRRHILARDVRDRIEAKGLPNAARPGAIE